MNMDLNNFSHRDQEIRYFKFIFQVLFALDFYMSYFWCC